MPLLRLAMYQPEIAANVGAAIRTAACFGAELHVIEPCGFPWKAQTINRVALDYGDIAPPTRHLDWQRFREHVPGRIVLLTTKATTSVHDWVFADGDTVLLGMESAGAPDAIHKAVDERLVIPLAPTARSLNVAMSGALALAEARRQIGY